MNIKQCSDDRFYLRKKLGGRVKKRLAEVHAGTKVRYYLMFSSSM